MACSSGTSPYFAVSYVGDVDVQCSTWPRAYRAAWANGWKVVCRQAGPPGSVMIGAMTLTSWARQAAVTRSQWRSSVISRLPSTTASATV